VGSGGAGPGAGPAAEWRRGAAWRTGQMIGRDAVKDRAGEREGGWAQRGRGEVRDRREQVKDGTCAGDGRDAVPGSLEPWRVNTGMLFGPSGEACELTVCRPTGVGGSKGCPAWSLSRSLSLPGWWLHGCDPRAALSVPQAKT
jgi:hypothetical protein